MANNYLITGYWGEPHVTVENDRGINAAIFGAGRFVLPVGNQFRAEYIGNNTVRVYDGKLIDNGAVAGIPAGQYIDLPVSEAGQGMKRNDIIVFQYSKDAATLVESGAFVVVKGAETSGTASDPELTQEDILSDTAAFDQMALWRVSVAGSVISDPVKVFKVARNTQHTGGLIVPATSADGATYVASVDSLDELSNGVELTIIPNMNSNSESITLNVNGLGAKQIRIPISSSTSLTTYPNANFLIAGRAVKLMYDSEYLNGGAWKTCSTQKTSGADIYGSTLASNITVYENLGFSKKITQRGLYACTVGYDEHSPCNTIMLSIHDLSVATESLFVVGDMGVCVSYDPDNEYIQVYEWGDTGVTPKLKHIELVCAYTASG